VEVEGEEISLDDIEHRILRPIWKDPLVHYGLCCASVGCPQLRVRAYGGERIPRQLRQAARAFVNHPRGAEVEGRTVTVSSLYIWYKVDFGGTDAAVITHLRRYAEGEQEEALARVDAIAGDRYDWSLNDLDVPA
jgi:hypothetical protein